MRNCLVLGCGRSGTSMLAGILHQAGYFMGDKLYQPGVSNPKGFFEWREINQINEAILSPYGRRHFFRLIRKIREKNSVASPGRNQHWLLSLPVRIRVRNDNPSVLERIKRVSARERFCYKDPRFSYTLPVWKPVLKPDTVFICVFREPQLTVVSILKECRTREYLNDLRINRRLAFQVWCRLYSHILAWNTDVRPHFFFVHYNQIYEGSALPSLSGVLDVELNAAFVDQNLKRPVSTMTLPKKAAAIYRRLCELANYRQVS